MSPRKSLRAICALAGSLVIAGAALPGRADTGASRASKKPVAAKPGRTKKATLPPLDGTTIDFSYDGKDIGHKERAWLGRSFIHKKAQTDPKKPLPLLVFIHGLNSELIKYRWMGGGNEGDVRRIVSELIDSGQVAPMIVAGPSSVVPQNIGVAVTSWMAFDLDHFVKKTAEALDGKATIDKSKIIVAAHSGGGCNIKGGIATAIGANNVHSALVIDTCMGTDLALALAGASKSLNVIVTWQAFTWAKRPLKDFRAVFTREAKKSPPNEGVLRVLDQMSPKKGMPHDAMVPLTLQKYLPQLVPLPKSIIGVETSTMASGKSAE